MKEYLIKETTEKDEQSRYSTYKNPDPELRKEIASFKLPENTVTLGWPEKEWTILEYEDNGEVKCQSGRNINYFPVDDIKEALERNLTYERNQKYQPHNYFKKHFGIISRVHKSKGNDDRSMSIEMLDMSDAASIGGFVGFDRPLDPTSVEFYGYFYDVKLNWWDDSMKLEGKQTCFFNEYLV